MGVGVEEALVVVVVEVEGEACCVSPLRASLERDCLKDDSFFPSLHAMSHVSYVRCNESCLVSQTAY